MMARATVVNKLKSTEGASIVIALVFFLICAVVGATVLTAATINSQATATYQHTRQNEYTVSSAAGTLAQQLQEGVVVEWEYGGSDPAVPTATQVSGAASDLAKDIWDMSSGSTSLAYKIWQQNQARDSYTIGGGVEGPLAVTTDTMETVYASVRIGQNYNITVTLSLNEDLTANAAYKETMTMQCVPSYDVQGRVTKLTWNTPVILKDGDAIAGGTP